MTNVRALPSLIVALPVLGLVAAPANARAHVTDVVITSCIDVLEGKFFGETGPYEKCVGKIYFALDPENPRNRIIVDLDKAPRNALGEVEFSADIFVLRPKDPSRGNGVLFFDVVNRGNKLLLGGLRGRLSHEGGLHTRRIGVGGQPEHSGGVPLSSNCHRIRQADLRSNQQLVHSPLSKPDLRHYILLLDRF